MPKKILFISYDGLTDPLGQSQILPYLIGLANKGYEIQIISAEKEERFQAHEIEIREKIKNVNIHWAYTHYTNRPPLLSTFLLVNRIKMLAHNFYSINHFDIVHSRSLIPAMIGLSLKRKYKSKLIFDIRGFWVDERVEGGLWNLRNPIFRLLYNFFKKKEKQLFLSADGIVSLTNNAKNFIQNHYKTEAQFAVIPCSVDVNHFDFSSISIDSKKQLRASLGIEESDFVLIYIGSLGTRYLLNEMIRFFKVLKNQRENAKMLFVSNSPKELILKEAEIEKVDIEDVIITSSNYQEIPKFINIADAGIFFIYTGFTGKAVSPTKQSELLAMGVPIVANKGVGDIETILQDQGLGVVLADFEDNSMAAAAKQLLQTDYNRENIRTKAKELFALDKAVETYSQLYAKL